MKAIIIHGANGNPNEHWFKWLGKQLDLEVFIPRFPIKHEQKLDNWMKVIEKIGVDEDTILIGHSVGCAFILSVLEKYKAKAAFLVGGFIGKGESLLKDLKLGNIVQFERFGFCRLDEIQKNKLVFWFGHK